jgi:MSHA biogenesis protein MshQ
MVVTSHSFASSSSWTAPAGMTESFDIASGVADAVGQTTETARVLQAARGATGAMTSTAANDADVGNAHVLALKAALEIPRPAGVSANDVMIASIGVTPSTAVITAPGGWTLIRRIDNASATSNSLLIFRKVATVAEPANYEWSVSGVDFAVGGVQAFFNVDTATPLDVEAGQCTPQPTCNVATNSHSTPSITTTVPNTMVVTSHTYASSRSWAPPPGFRVL